MVWPLRPCLKRSSSTVKYMRRRSGWGTGRSKPTVNDRIVVKQLTTLERRGVTVKFSSQRGILPAKAR